MTWFLFDCPDHGSFALDLDVKGDTARRKCRGGDKADGEWQPCPLMLTGIDLDAAKALTPG